MWISTFDVVLEILYALSSMFERSCIFVFTIYKRKSNKSNWKADDQVVVEIVKKIES